MARVTSFLDPWADPYNSGFQLTQSLIAIGRGEWFGVGLGESVQKLFYLPEAHTDFLFAVLAEELGLVGVAATLALFIALVWRSFWIAQLAARAGLKFQAYLAAGFGLWLGAQAFINIGVNMGVLPTKGLTLPLMSYGRSSMIVTLAWVGLLLRVYHEAMHSSRGMASARRDERDARPRMAEAERDRTDSHGARTPCSSWPAARAATCSPRSRWRACCAPRRCEVVWLGTPRGLEARVVPAENISDRVALDERPARQGCRDAARRAFQARAVDLAGAGDHAAQAPRRSWSASAASSPARAASPPGSRADRS